MWSCYQFLSTIDIESALHWFFSFRSYYVFGLLIVSLHPCRPLLFFAWSIPCKNLIFNTNLYILMASRQRACKQQSWGIVSPCCSAFPYSYRCAQRTRRTASLFTHILLGYCSMDPWYCRKRFQCQGSMMGLRLAALSLGSAGTWFGKYNLSF